MTVRTMLKMFAAPAIALAALSGCATPFNAQVARFQQLPPAQGQSFAVVAEDMHKAGGLEFAHYADLIAAQLVRYGYVRAADPASAQLIVRVDYAVDQGHERIYSTGFADPFWYGPGYYRGFRGRYGYGYGYGFRDPWLFGGPSTVDSYMVYGSWLKVRIDRPGSGKAVFEGTARAQSQSNHLTYLVPNLVDAMFTNFPGNSGEEIKVTVPPEPKVEAQAGAAPAPAPAPMK